MSLNEASLVLSVDRLTRMNETLMHEKSVLKGDKASAENRAERFATFIEAIGIDSTAVDQGYWISKSAALIDVELDEAAIESRLGPLAPDTKESILLAARRLIKHPRKR